MFIWYLIGGVIAKKFLTKVESFKKKIKGGGGDAHIREEGGFAYRTRDQTFCKLCAKMF